MKKLIKNDICVCKQCTNALVTVEKVSRKQKKKKKAETHFVPERGRKMCKPNLALFTHLDDFYSGSVDELPSTIRVCIKVTRVKERRKSNKN